MFISLLHSFSDEHIHHSCIQQSRKEAYVCRNHAFAHLESHGSAISTFWYGVLCVYMVVSEQLDLVIWVGYVYVYSSTVSLKNLMFCILHQYTAIVLCRTCNFVKR